MASYHSSHPLFLYGSIAVVAGDLASSSLGCSYSQVCLLQVGLPEGIEACHSPSFTVIWLMTWMMNAVGGDRSSHPAISPWFVVIVACVRSHSSSVCLPQDKIDIVC